MSILIISPSRDTSQWVAALQEQEPGVRVQVYPEVEDPDSVEFILTWRHPHGVFQNFPKLKVIASMGAGVDHITSDKDLPSEVLITRIIDGKLSEDMAVFVLALVLNHLRNISLHHCSQEWKPLPYHRPEEVRIGIMGLGVLGKAAALRLSQNGFKISGWSATRKSVPGVRSYSGEGELGDFLAESQILVCLLPLTSSTESILNRSLFDLLPDNAYLINVARGALLVEQDLIQAILSGKLSGASLDVFCQEPLPEEHPFRREKRIRITPHVASITHPSSVASQVLDNYFRMQQGKPLLHLVQKEKEY